MAIRAYREVDLEACIRICDVIWRFSERLSPPSLAGFALQHYVRGSLAVSDHAWVVEEDGAVLGLLFGRTGVGLSIDGDYGGVRGSARTLMTLLTLPKMGLREMVRWLHGGVVHARNRARVQPDADGEVTLFAMDPDAQGRGSGRLLMDGFVEQCRVDGTDRIVLETDRDSSYGFYDHYGFVRGPSFMSPVYAFLTGDEEVFLYQLTLR
jgi:ribosomal protein S18 acetylase RimI-like enzyme